MHPRIRTLRLSTGRRFVSVGRVAFVFIEPLLFEKRHVALRTAEHPANPQPVRAGRTAVIYPAADKIVLVLVRLSFGTPATPLADSPPL